ncbi:SufS family cysteine desulfurase [Halovenus salina]|uniref:cysteine desulfurase n=1 Tax=Halovenus salina TaxID=1510225 RepID=A0ABD5W6M3_9EURY
MVRDIQAIRDDFPILDREIDGTPLVYLDNAATTQTPESVYEVFETYYREYNSNIHRGIHTLSHEASVAYEEAHDRLAEFVGASGGREELVFTKNTTESINLVAYGLGLQNLGPDDTIVTTEMEHHASLVTWQQIAELTGATIQFIRVNEDGHLDMEHATELIGPETAVLSVTHVSNVLGTVNPVTELAELAHEHDAYVVVDGAQSVPTRPVDVEEMDADFFAFSGHKMAGPTGIGCLYGKRHLLDEMDPFLYGGEMITHVTLDRSVWNDPPWKFEAGTPPIAEGIALAAAADYLDDIGMDRVREHEDRLAQYLLERLEDRDDATIYGPPSGEQRAGLVSFNVDGVHGHDMSSLLNDRGIAVRAGDHCTQPLHETLDIPGSVRASFYVYNTTDDIDALLDAIDDAEEKRDAYLRSERYHDAIYDHHENPSNAGVLSDPTVRKSSEETVCGDDGEFYVDIGPGGTIEQLAFESQSCAVSQAVASILSEHLKGMHLEEVAELDAIESLLDGQFPPLRRDCVLGPEDVIREAAREYVDRPRTTH